MWWKIEIKDHPITGTGQYTFSNIEQLEMFVGKKDIQVDHITGISRIGVGGVKDRFNCVDILDVRSTRLLLIRKE